MFESMVSKKLIEWIWLGASVVVVIAGLVWVLSQPSPERVGIAGIALVLYLGLVRVFAESLIVIFNIDDNLRRSRIALEQMQSGQHDLASRIDGMASRIHDLQATSKSTVAVPVQNTTPIETKGSKETEGDVAPFREGYNDLMMATRERLMREAREKRGR